MRGQLQRICNRSKDFLFLPVLAPAWRNRLRGKVLCLLYHRVDGGGNNSFLTRGGSPVIEPRELEQDIRFLKEQGALFLTFQDLREEKFPDSGEFGIIVSFDDCFLDNYTNGLDVLESLGVKAVFFQSTAMVEARELLWEHALYWFTRDAEGIRRFAALSSRLLGPLNGVDGKSGKDVVEFLREQVAPAAVETLVSRAREEFGATEAMGEIAESIYAQPTHLQTALRLGHEIGSHGHRHYKRANIDEPTFEHELRRSSERLEAITGQRPQAFSFPFNSHQAGDRALCAKYFSQAITVDRDLIRRDSDPLWLPRYSWPGPTDHWNRRRRWLLTGEI